MSPKDRPKATRRPQKTNPRTPQKRTLDLHPGTRHNHHATHTNVSAHTKEETPMLSAIGLIMTLAGLISAVLAAEKQAAGQPGATKLTIAKATATAAINALVGKYISQATADWLQTGLTDAINIVVGILNLIGGLTHSTSPAS